MKRYIYMFLSAAALLAACTDDPTSDPMPADGGETWVTVEFGHRSYEQVTINTRAALSDAAESRVTNVYVCVFDSKGQRIYGRYFDQDDLRSSAAEVANASQECWFVHNMTGGAGDKTYGSIRLKVPQHTGCEIFMLANIDADMVNISPERLNYIHNRKELKELAASLNQRIVSRNGYFPMNGSVENVDISDTSITSGGSPVKVTLRRLDAKIEVNISIAKNTSSSTDIQYDPDGSGTLVPAERKQSIVEFRPESWQVVNLPGGCFVCERDKTPDADHRTYDAHMGYFSSSPMNFDSSSAEKSSFAFYMLENRPKAKHDVSGFHDRDRRIKDANGEYDTSAGLWANAPEEGTYLIIKGEVVMDVDVSVEAKKQKLNAIVTYYIHLGDFGSDVNNYDIERNTHYRFNITIKGVDKIQAEVEKGSEDESAATGHVYIAKESIFTFDAHYGQRAFAFDEAFISPSTITWYVKTPFGREGKPEVVNGVEVPNGLDYQWVHFMVNDPEKPDDPSSPYSRVHPSYDPAETMDVAGFVAFIKEQKSLFDARKKEFPDDPGQWTVGNAFRPEQDTDYPAGRQTRYRIWATAFVDEYYYEEDPISGKRSPTLWKRFVNQPHRLMHLLCDTQYSKDGESLATGSVVTIRQRSIQSIYAPESDAEVAWGLENIDETAGKLWFYDSREKIGTSDEEMKGYCTQKNFGNDSEGNGLYNSLILWDLLDGGKFKTGEKWSDYLNFNKENDAGYLYLREDRTDLKTARYACMMRNRDNNGNGIIDASEVRWYMASIRQLVNLYIGEQGISDDAKLYTQGLSDQFNFDNTQQDSEGFDLGRNHVISSTKGSNGYPRIIWTEEGLSTSDYRQPQGWGKNGRYSVRCVRHLGVDYATEEEAQQGIAAKVSPIAAVTSVSGPGLGNNYETPTEQSVYTFDLSNLNRASVRFYTSRELEPSDQFSEMSRTYYRFETGPLVHTYDATAKDFNTAESEYRQKIISNIMAGKSPCPAGYRMPNVREVSLMAEYLPWQWWNGKCYYTISYLEAKESKSWWASHRHLTIDGPGKPITMRCVRDIR